MLISLFMFNPYLRQLQLYSIAGKPLAYAINK